MSFNATCKQFSTEALESLYIRKTLIISLNSSSENYTYVNYQPCTVDQGTEFSKMFINITTKDKHTHMYVNTDKRAHMQTHVYKHITTYTCTQKHTHITHDSLDEKAIIKYEIK